MQRIDAIKTTLTSELERLFTQGSIAHLHAIIYGICSFVLNIHILIFLSDHTIPWIGLKSKDMKVVQQGLRTYMLIDRVVDAESIFINTVVKPFVAKVIFMNCVVSR